jgi:hypothetical protein
MVVQQKMAPKKFFSRVKKTLKHFLLFKLFAGFCYLKCCAGVLCCFNILALLILLALL